MSRYVVGRVSELPPGARRIVDANGRSIGVFNVKGHYYALLNRCPHQAAPLCRGAIKGMTMPSAPGEYVWAREGEILRCPWHGWEFDITNGRSIYNPHRMRVRTYEVTVEASGSATDDEDERVETYPVTVEDGIVILHA
ncbi:MAG: Rieske (2Fe-2S) protein [Chloroflexi bacterium]|nr:Rieske (2Fe-2S) protein [Chloroflexota bacterium]